MTEEEQETIEVHGYEGRKAEFKQNEREGVKVGGQYSGGDCPGIDIVLTKFHVYGVHEDTRDILLHADISFEYQWHNEHGEPVDKDANDAMSGEPTVPKEGAVEDAISEMRGMVTGFSTGWTTRHERGPEYDNIQEYADSLAEVHNVREIVKVNGPKREIEASIYLPNSAWGLPGEVYRWVDDHPTLEIVDFKNISEDSVTIILDYDSSRASRW